MGADPSAAVDRLGRPRSGDVPGGVRQTLEDRIVEDDVRLVVDEDELAVVA
jgi:hypothetical protein